MKVFVAGATGAIGMQLVPMLVEGGHEVTGMTRIAAKADAIRAMGAKPAVADALDPEAVAEAVAHADPDAVIHQLSVISRPSADKRPRQPARREARFAWGTQDCLAIKPEGFLRVRGDGSQRRDRGRSDAVHQRLRVPDRRGAR